MTHPERYRFEELLLALRAAAVDFVICGGLAAVLHGVERPTLDIDVATPLTAENLRRLASALRTLGMQPRVPVDPGILADREEVRRIVEEKQAVVFTFIHPQDALLSLDIFLRDELSYETLRPHAVEKEYLGGVLLVLSMEKLLELKRSIRPPRSKDAADIAELERLIHEHEAE